MERNSKHKTPAPIIEDIESVARLEQNFLRRRNWAEFLADVIGGFVGSIWFVALHLCWFGAWFYINTGHTWIRPFDRYPFILLSMIVSVEAVLLSTFVLMKQNRMSRRGDQRDQLQLQIAMLAERESTKNLQLLRALCTHLGVTPPLEDSEAQALSESTSVDQLMEDLENRLPE